MERGTESALAQLALAAVLWGTSFPVISVGIRAGLDPVLFVFLRFAVAAPLMLTFARAKGMKVRSTLMSTPVWALGVINSAGFLAQFIGQQYTDASVAALLVNLSVVFAAIGGAVFLGERLGVMKGTGVVLAFGGTVLITVGGSPLRMLSGQGLGEALYLFAAVTWAGYMVYAKRVSTTTEPLVLSTCVVSATAVLVLPFAAFSSSAAVPGLSSLLAVAYTAVFNTAIPFVLYQRGLSRLTVAASAVVLMLEIVVALIISVVFLGEGLSALALVGSGAIVASIFLVSGVELGRRRAKPPEASAL